MTSLCIRSIETIKFTVNRFLTLLCFRYDVATLGFTTTDQTGKLGLETVGMNTELSYI